MVRSALALTGLFAILAVGLALAGHTPTPDAVLARSALADAVPAQAGQQPQTQPRGPRIGQPVIRPDWPTYRRDYGFLETAPVATIPEPGVLEVRFTTVEPTPPARLYVGVSTLDETLDLPRYRATANESGAADDWRTDHVMRIDFDRAVLRRLFTTPYEPKINWRAEVWMPGKRSARFVEGRCYFDPETKRATTNILAGPMVERVAETSAVIRVRLEEAQSSVTLELGSGDSVGDRRIISRASGSSRDHEVLITDLQPNRRYSYAVTVGSTTTRTYAFRTAGGDRVRFAALADSREGTGGGVHNFGGANAHALHAISAHAYQQDLDFVFFCGDLINGYTTRVADFRMQLDAWQHTMGPLHARVPIYEAMGNHEALIDHYARPGTTERLSVDKEGPNSAEAIFADVFANPTNGPRNEGPGSPTYSENVYYFDHGNVRVFVLNNNYWWSSNPHEFGGNLEGYILPRQIEWLRAEIQRAEQDPTIDHVFAGAQEPVFPNGGHTQDAMWYGFGPGRSQGGDTNGDERVDERDIDIVQNRNTLWEILSGSRKFVGFITGDEHAYSRTFIAPDTPVGPRTNQAGEESVFAHAAWHITSGGAGAPYYDRETTMPWSEYCVAHSTLPHYAMIEVDGDDVSLVSYSYTGQIIDEAVLRRDGVNVRE